MKEQKYHFYYLLIIWILCIYIFFIYWKNFISNKYLASYYLVKTELKELNEKIDNKPKKEINYFINNFNLKDYTWTKFKITNEWKKIIKNIRALHKSSSLIWKENADREVCAWYIWTLTEKIWWKQIPYHIWMMNTKTRKPAKAWELASFYKWLGWDVLIDLWNKFSVNKKDFWEKISKNQLKMFFKTAFLEEALLWDIWFLYKDTKYTSFLNNWSANSHITKNMWISNFEYIIWKDYDGKSDLSIIADSIWCSNDIKKDLFSILSNYNLKINWKKVFLDKTKLYYLNEDNTLWNKITLKYLDKLSYSDISLSHYYNSRSNVNWLFEMTCSGKFFPINIISINSRLIEKM